MPFNLAVEKAEKEILAELPNLVEVDEEKIITALEDIYDYEESYYEDAAKAISQANIINVVSYFVV